MKYSLTIAYTSCRFEPQIKWFMDSLALQEKRLGVKVKVIWIDGLDDREWTRPDVLHKRVKPNIWQGKYRLTKDNWWAVAAGRNSALCLCQTEWIAFVDDRSVLSQNWLEGVCDAMERGMVFCGSYDKRQNMTVENGLIKNGGTIFAVDPREKHCLENKLPNPFQCPGSWTFGCSIALPLEWALEINGYDETCDGISQEDCVFGIMLENRGRKFLYYKDCKLSEDRTTGRVGPDMIRRDFGKNPIDKSHALNERLLKRSEAEHYPYNWNLRKVRADVLSGKGWPIPTFDTPPVDWYLHDGKPKLISDFV